MKCFVSAACVLSLLIVFSSAAPFPANDGISASASAQVGPSGSTTAGGGGGGGLTNILQNIDLPGLLRGVNSFIGVIRVFCPPLSQVLDNVIQNVTSTAFRVFGRAILQNGGLGGGTGGGGGGRVNVVLPTFPPDDDDYDDDDQADDNSDIDSRISTSNSSQANSLNAEISEVTTSAVSPVSDENIISKRHVRVARGAETDDQDIAASAPQPAEDLSNVEADDADRNKRFLPFGGDGHGSTGGSGNFLFDIIRNTADNAGRTLGTVYRMIAGTENVGLGLTTTRDTDFTATKLVAGSGATEESDEKANAPGGVAEVDIAKGADGYTEGIPGPITRLFVIANRGIANLVQDLILRLAQTSERLVNFKARLVTALI